MSFFCELLRSQSHNFCTEVISRRTEVCTSTWTSLFLSSRWSVSTGHIADVITSVVSSPRGDRDRDRLDAAGGALLLTCRATSARFAPLRPLCSTTGLTPPSLLVYFSRCGGVAIIRCGVFDIRWPAPVLALSVQMLAKQVRSGWDSYCCEKWTTRSSTGLGV